VGNTNARRHLQFAGYEGAARTHPGALPAQIAAEHGEVRAANLPVLEAGGRRRESASLGIQHVFLIIKENDHTRCSAISEGQTAIHKLTIYGREITPNHHALAERYVLLDNSTPAARFSFRWPPMADAGLRQRLRGACVFAASRAGYAYNMADALVSADRLLLQRAKPCPIRLYGECQVAGRWNPATQSSVDINESEGLSWTDYWKAYKDGSGPGLVGARRGSRAGADIRASAIPILTAINIRFAPRSSSANSRSARTERYPAASASSPSTAITPTAPARISHPRAMVADDDLRSAASSNAFSQSPIWKDSLILVTEDDAQNGVDHVERHRTRRARHRTPRRRGALDSNHYNHSAMIRTIRRSSACRSDASLSETRVQ